MARGDSRLGTWQVLLTISMVIAPLSAHGRHSLAAASRRHHHHRNHSSVTKEALDARMGLSDDSAERDHLIGAGLGLGAGLPLGSRHHSHKHTRLDFSEDDQPVGEELTAGGAGPDHPGNPLSDDVVTVEFHSPAPDAPPSDVSPDWPMALEPLQQKGGAPTSWTAHDFYDYQGPDGDTSALDTTPEPEPSPSPPPDMEDENPLLVDFPVAPDNVKPNEKSGPSLPAPPVPGQDRGQGLGLGGAVGPDGCRLGFVRSGPGVCVSLCDVEPNFCFNGGVCTVVAGMGAFCRCNVQEYIWNKGSRCDWAVTEFQVMCAVVGVASLVLLLLFMIVVFFAKRLYRLKNENKRLRKLRSKYRPQSTEPQTDGLSVSTTADGSQPNVRKLCDTPPPPPQAHAHNLAYYDNIICQDEPQKQDDAVKSPPPKEEETMNIRNSHSPKQENNRPISNDHDHGHAPNNTEENAEDGVTIGLEVLLPKEAKLRPETSPPLQYDVFLHKVADSGDRTSHGHAPATHPSKPHPSSPGLQKSPEHAQEYPPHSVQSDRRRHSSPGRHPSPSHPVPGCHSAPDCHLYNSHASPSRCQHKPASLPQLRGPEGRSQGQTWRGSRGLHTCPSPSSPHLDHPPRSPSRGKYSPASTHSLPPLS